MAPINRQQLVEQLSQEILKSLVIPIRKLVREELEIERDVMRKALARDITRLVEQQLIRDRKLVKNFVQKNINEIKVTIKKQTQKNQNLTQSFEDEFLNENQQPQQREERHYSDDSEVDNILQGTEISSDVATILGPEYMRTVNQQSPAFRQAVQIQTNRSNNENGQSVRSKNFDFEFMNEMVERMEESGQEMKKNNPSGAASLLMEHSEGAVQNMDMLYDPKFNKTKQQGIINPNV